MNQIKCSLRWYLLDCLQMRSLSFSFSFLIAINAQLKKIFCLNSFSFSRTNFYRWVIDARVPEFCVGREGEKRLIYMRKTDTISNEHKKRKGFKLKVFNLCNFQEDFYVEKKRAEVERKLMRFSFLRSTQIFSSIWIIISSLKGNMDSRILLFVQDYVNHPSHRRPGINSPLLKKFHPKEERKNYWFFIHFQFLFFAFFILLFNGRDGCVK